MLYDLVGLEEMRRAAYGPRPGSGGGMNVGFIAPTIIFERQREINGGAHGLDQAIKGNVGVPGIGDPQFQARWQAWLDLWNAFFAKYQTESGKAAALLMTDELAAQTESKRIELESFKAEYQMRCPSCPVPAGMPPPIPHPPPQPPEPPKGPLGFTIPWWVWALGGAAVVGAGVYVYVTMKNVGKQREFVLGEYFGRGKGHDLPVHSGDVDRAGGWHVRRDPAPSYLAQRDPSAPDSLVARALNDSSSSVASDRELLTDYANLRDEVSKRGLLR